MRKKNEHIVGWDPSINYFGWGLLRLDDMDPPWLIESGILKSPTRYMRSHKVEGNRRILWMACEIDKMLTDWRKKRGFEIRYAVMEKPHLEKYPTDFPKGSPQRKKARGKKGIDKLLLTAGAACGVLAVHGIPVAFGTASQWKAHRSDPDIQLEMEGHFPTKIGKWEGLDELMAVGVAMWAWEAEQHGRLVITKP